MKVVLTSERQVWKAVIVCAQNMVQNNISFNSCNEDNDLYWQMFPASSIVKNYCQGCGKVKYVIQFCISLYIYQKTCEEWSSRPVFYIFFDQTIFSQVTTQYDGCATHFSPKHKEKSSTYCVYPCVLGNASLVICWSPFTSLWKKQL